MAAVTLEALVTSVGVPLESLERKCTYEHMVTISEDLDDWRRVAPWLKLSEAAVVEIEQDGKNEPQKRLKTLQMWRGRLGYFATYRMLVDVFLRVGRADQAERVCKLVGGKRRAI